jgi:hypothetical protein
MPPSTAAPSACRRPSSITDSNTPMPPGTLLTTPSSKAMANRPMKPEKSIPGIGGSTA